MALTLVKDQENQTEMASSLNKRSSLRTLVACSKGTEWMESSYRAWQLRTPLGIAPKRNICSVLRLVRRIASE